MSKILSIDCALSAPPSELLLFRDVSMFAKIFKKMDVIAISPKDMIDFYVKWMKPKGYLDYIDDILEPNKVNASIEIQSGKLTIPSYIEIISILNKIK